MCDSSRQGSLESSVNWQLNIAELPPSCVWFLWMMTLLHGAGDMLEVTCCLTIDGATVRPCQALSDCPPACVLLASLGDMETVKRIEKRLEPDEMEGWR